MLIVRSLRQDRVTFCVTSFIIDNLGGSFVEPPALDMKAVSVSSMLSYTRLTCLHQSYPPSLACNSQTIVATISRL